MAMKTEKSKASKSTQTSKSKGELYQVFTIPLINTKLRNRVDSYSIQFCKFNKTGEYGYRIRFSTDNDAIIARIMDNQKLMQRALKRREVKIVQTDPNTVVMYCKFNKDELKSVYKRPQDIKTLIENKPRQYMAMLQATLTRISEHVGQRLTLFLDLHSLQTLTQSIGLCHHKVAQATSHINKQRNKAVVVTACRSTISKRYYLMITVTNTRLMYDDDYELVIGADLLSGSERSVMVTPGNPFDPAMTHLQMVRSSGYEVCRVTDLQYMDNYLQGLADYVASKFIKLGE